MIKGPHMLPGHKCPLCGGRITWEQKEIIRRDGYYDWCLDVCCSCGAVLNPDIVEAAYRHHLFCAVENIKDMQNKTLDMLLGSDVHLMYQAEGFASEI